MSCRFVIVLWEQLQGAEKRVGLPSKPVFGSRRSIHHLRNTKSVCYINQNVVLVVFQDNLKHLSMLISTLASMAVVFYATIII